MPAAMRHNLAMIRVAVTVEQLWHRVPGGTATATLGLLDALAARDDVAVVGAAAWHARPPRPGFRTDMEIRHMLLPRLALYESWHRLRLPRIQRATGEVHLVHATTMAIPPRSAPLVVTIHDLAFVDRPQDFTARGMRLFTRGLDLARRDADVIAVPSEATRYDCTAQGFDPGRIVVVPWGVTARPPVSRSELRTRFGIHKPYVLWTGTIEPRKNLPRLLDAFATVTADVDLVLAGPRGWKEDLGDRIAADPRIKTIGFVDADSLAGLYAAAEAFCYPSLKEGFGLPVLEAMAQGAPVITSRGTSTEEVAGDAAVLVDPLDREAIAGALTRLLEDRDLAGRLGRGGRKRAAEFTWARTAELTMRAYRQALENAR